jgi:hypothetical protein
MASHRVLLVHIIDGRPAILIQESLFGTLTQRSPRTKKLPEPVGSRVEPLNRKTEPAGVA